MIVKIDMQKAREIWRNKIRSQRAEEFKQLDTEYMIADESGDDAKKNAVIVRKKQLRDAPEDPRIDAANTVEELKKAWPFN